MNKERKHFQFSKLITAAFSLVTIPLSAYVVYECLVIAKLAVQTGFMGALPYLTAIVGFVEGTIGLVFGLYHSNSKTEKKVLAQSSVQTTVNTVQTSEEYHEVTNLNVDY